jgi:hypothetical protein
MAGVICGLLNSMMVVLISFASHLPIYEGTMVVYHFFANLTGNVALASLAEKVAVEVADKTISFFLVAVAIVFVRDYLNWNKKDAKVTSG